MAKIYAHSFGKKFFLCLMGLLSLFVTSAQTDISIGTGTTGNTGTTYPTPIPDWFEGNRMQFLYRASELTAAGMGPGNVNAIKFNVTNLNTFSGNIQQYTIKIGGTAVGTLTNTGWENVPNTVYGPVNYTPTLGINTFTFSTPYFWNGTENIVIEICTGLPGNETDGIIHYTNNVTVPWTTGLSFNGSHTRAADNAGNLCGTATTTNTGTQTSRPNVTFSWTQAPPCNGAPTAGTATGNPSTVCLNQNISLTSAGVTVATGLNYQWQVSTDNGTNWSNVTGGTAITITTTQMVTSLYRLRVTCTATNDISYSNTVLITSPPVPSGVYTISNNPTTWPTGRNFGSFNDAYNAIKCGIADAVVFDIQLTGSPYNEQLIINGPIPNASTTNTITFKGNGATIGFTANNTNERAVFKLKNGAKHFIFDSLIVNASAGTYGYGFHFLNNADSNVIRKCTINSSTTSSITNYAGIVINGSDAGLTNTGTVVCDANQFLNNTIVGGYYGVVMAATFNGGANGDNKIIGNNIREFYHSGVYVAGSYNSTIEANMISRPTRTSVGEFNGILFTTEKSTTAVINRNRITNPFGGALTSTSAFNGINFSSADGSVGSENTVSNNLIYNINGNGPQAGIANTGSDYVYYYHNTVALDYATSTSTSTTRGLFQTTPAVGIVIYNNIISITRGGTGTKHAVYLGASLPVDINYNNYHINAPGTNNFIGFYTANRATLANWQAATSLESASMNANPSFLDPANGNYSPGNAALDNKGTYVFVDSDINNAPRDQNTPDIGAYEFTPPPCSTPPVLGTTSISVGRICQNNPVFLTLNIGAYGSAQTFQWQSSATSNGTYTSFGSPMLTPDTTILASQTLYYRAAVTCGSSTVYSDPVLLTVDPVLPAGTYTIDTTSPASYVPGVAGGNFRSFGAAKAAMSCGIGGAVVFNVVANTGPYVEKLTLNYIVGSSATNTITFNGNGNTITGTSNVNTDRAIIKLNDADHITFDSLTIDGGSGTYGYAVQLINNADSNTIRRSTIISRNTGNQNFAGIVINASDASAATTGSTFSDGNLIDNNTIVGGFYGITLVGGTTSAASIADNKITNNTIRDFYSIGLQVGGTTNTLIEKNRFSRPNITVTAPTVYGIYATASPNLGLRISKNKFHSFFTGIPNSTATVYGIYHNLVDATNAANIVSNNLIHSFGGNGALYGLYNNGSDNIKYYHNTISFDQTTSIATQTTAGFYQTTSAIDIELINNLINITRGGNANKYAVYFGSTASTITANYNNYFVKGSGANNFIGFYSTNRATLADWKAGSNQDANSLNIEPLFVNPGTGDYRPGITPLDNKGTNTVNITSDILDVARTATPDIGAFEFAAPACANPPVAGTTVVTPATGACLESPLSLTLNGNSPVGSLTFQWQSSANGTDWNNISGILYTPDYDTLTTTNTWYRAAVTCNGVTTFSAPLQITLGNILPAGTYAISSSPTTYTGPNTGTNFQTFNEAVDAMRCGIGGKVIFNVAPGTYTEQVRIPYIPGTSAVNTVTFQSQNGNPASATLTFGATSAAAPYTLKLDSTINFIFRNMSFASTGTTYARVIEIGGTAANDTLANNIITAPTAAAVSNNVTGIYAFALKGTRIFIKSNTVNNGSHGIYFTGTGAANNLTQGHLIDSNIVNNTFGYGIYTGFHKGLMLRGNTVNLATAVAPTGYGMYVTDCDSSFTITGNRVRISNTTTTVYGLYVNNSDSSITQRGQILNNIITTSGTNSGNMYGLYINNSAGHGAVNNVISLNNTGNVSYGFFTNSSVATYWNNSVSLTSTATTNGYAAYIQNASTANVNLRNNIFSNQGGGRAMFVSTTSLAGGADYNMLYAAGSTLVQRGSPAGTFATLDAWRNASFWDVNSIVYQPAFATNTDLQPDLANPNVWAMHGRGIQIGDNTRDINNSPRPTTLTTGVPDLGAYEFFPTVQPTVLTPVPATPAPNSTQVFMYGTDTVMKVTWGATAPPDVTAQRFSGVPPTGNKPSPDSMFFYTRLQSTVAGNFPYKMDLFYIDPWQGSIPNEHQIGLGKTTQSNVWVVGFNSRVDTRKNVITESNLTFYDKFTGFVNPYAPPILPDKDSSNRGRRFWVAYPVNQLNGGSGQEMVLYLSALETANVQVKINGTNWVRNYTVQANTVKVSDLIPKTGPDNAFINTAGLSQRGISIEADVPIVAYAHVYGSASSGASMLMPVGVWGYEYRTLGITQDYGLNSFAYYYVIADNDNTVVEITSASGIGVQNAGMTAGTPYTVTLNKGEFFQVVASSQTQELSGSNIKSIPNAQGKCYPIAVFSGSSRTAIDIPCAGGGDFIMQQNFPSTAWGKRYLTAPASSSGAANTLQGSIYRVAVKDPTTVVKRNGVTLTGIVNNFYYQFTSATADYIEADKPIMVAQYFSGACTGVGDPEMIYLSPIEQGIDQVGFYRNTNEGIDVNYLTLIVPSDGTGLTSLTIVDGTTTVNPDFTYPHPQNALLGQNYAVVVKRWTSAQQQVRVQSDSAFTAITYGQGSVESYGYNAGTLVKNLNSLGSITNTLSSSGNSTEFTCVGSPFRFTALLPLQPTSLTWKFSAVPGLTPNRDTTILNPVPSGSVVINRTTYYVFPINQNYTFAAPGVYGVQISYTHPDIESCDNTKNDVIYVQVLPAPKTNFTITPAQVCVGGTVQFGGESTTENGILLNNWSWTFHDNSTANTQNASFTYPTAGTFDVKLRTITPDGCLGDSTKQVVVNPRPTVNLVANQFTVCAGSDTVLRVQNPVAGTTYNWYTTATGGTPIATNQTSLQLTSITAAASYYVEAVSTASCASTQRARADITLLPRLTTPVVTVSAVTPNTITFTWQAVGGANYEVSVNNGTTWTAPSSGANGTTHFVTGLGSFQDVTLLVRAVGTVACQTSTNGTATGRTISSEVFIPNTFTPNGDGRNDVLLVYGYGVREMQMMIFNQWGEKIFETRSQTIGWDGTYKGKAQPSGVYMYVSKFTLLDGTVIEKKGSINLIR